MRKIFMGLSLLISLTICLQLKAGAQNNTTTSQVSPEAKAVITELLEVTGSRHMMETVMSTMLDNIKSQSPGMPADFLEEFKKGISYDSLVTELFPIYARHWSVDDLKGMVAFYKTPLGQKMVQEMPKVMQESMKAGMERSRAVIERLVGEKRALQGPQDAETTAAEKERKEEALPVQKQ